jgi:hypothetical protein
LVTNSEFRPGLVPLAPAELVVIVRQSKSGFRIDVACVRGGWALHWPEGHPMPEAVRTLARIRGLSLTLGGTGPELSRPAASGPIGR